MTHAAATKGYGDSVAGRLGGVAWATLALAVGLLLGGCGADTKAPQTGGGHATAQAAYARGMSLKQNGRAGEAIAAFRRAAVADRTMYQAQYQLGLIYRAQGRRQLSRQAFYRCWAKALKGPAQPGFSQKRAIRLCQAGVKSLETQLAARSPVLRGTKAKRDRTRRAGRPRAKKTPRTAIRQRQAKKPAAKRKARARRPSKSRTARARIKRAAPTATARAKTAPSKKVASALARLRRAKKPTAKPKTRAGRGPKGKPPRRPAKKALAAAKPKMAPKASDRDKPLAPRAKQPKSPAKARPKPAPAEAVPKLAGDLAGSTLPLTGALPNVTLAPAAKAKPTPRRRSLAAPAPRVKAAPKRKPKAPPKSKSKPLAKVKAPPISKAKAPAESKDRKQAAIKTKAPARPKAKTLAAAQTKATPARKAKAGVRPKAKVLPAAKTKTPPRPKAKTKAPSVHKTKALPQPARGSRARHKAPSTSHAVLCYSSRSPGRVRAFARKLRRAGYATRIRRRPRQKGGYWYQVLVGCCTDYHRARRLARMLVRKGLVKKPVVTPHRPK